jgi:DNA polymerase III alpha subunit
MLVFLDIPAFQALLRTNPLDQDGIFDYIAKRITPEEALYMHGEGWKAVSCPFGK